VIRGLWRERVRYWFDNTMSRGTPALIGLLALGTVVLVVIVAGLMTLFVPDRSEWLNHENPLWATLMRAFDPGNLSSDYGNGIFVALTLTATLGGIFLLSALIGILNTGLDARIAELRKGRSRVVERGHTVVLGWSDQVFTIISELVIANDGHDSCVAILADRDKVEMEDAIRAKLHHTGKLRVVCRTGDPTDPIDLEIMRPDEAGTIIVPVPAVDDPDIHVIKTLLALRNRPWRRGRPPVVAAVGDSSNVPAAVLAGGDGAQIIDTKDITARLVVQSRRHPGLSAVWNDLLGFEGDEIYIVPEPGLAGATYGDALHAFGTAALLGLWHANGTVEVNPSADTVLRTDDQVVVAAKTRSSIRRTTTPVPIDTEAIRDVPRGASPVEDTLVLGWNDRGPTILRQLDRYLPPDSTVSIAATGVNGVTVAGLGELRHLKVTAVACSPTDRPALEALDPVRFEHVIVLAEDGSSPEHADARTLVTLLHLRDLKEKRGAVYSIVSELNDDANRRLAQVTRADDFVISRKLISLYLTQLSQNLHLSDVFAELFDAHGSDLYLIPAEEYVVLDRDITFATVVEAARRRNETAIGYRRQADAFAPPAYGVVLNPEKSSLVRLAAGDRVVVLSKV
jgi:Trk K+ transport system NAD-binding subunit